MTSISILLVHTMSTILYFNFVRTWKTFSLIRDSIIIYLLFSSNFYEGKSETLLKIQIHVVENVTLVRTLFFFLMKLLNNAKNFPE